MMMRGAWIACLMETRRRIVIWMTSCCECWYDFLYGFRCDEFSGAVVSEIPAQLLRFSAAILETRA